MLLNLNVIRKEKVVVKQASKVRRKYRKSGKSPELEPWSNSAMHLYNLQHISNLRIPAFPSINWVHYNKLSPLLAPNCLWFYNDFHSPNNS